MEKRLLQLFGLIVFLLVLWNWWNPLWRFDLNEAPQPNNKDKVVFSIDKGSSARTIAKNLKTERLVVDRVSFLKAVESKDLADDLRYGRFVLSPSMTLKEVVDILTTQGSGTRAITVIEGWTIQEIDDHLTEQGLAKAGEFKQCVFNCKFEYKILAGHEGSLEGFLFPDTYFIDESTFTVEGLIDQMISTFDVRITDEMIQDIEKSGRSLSDVVNVASMIEKEVRTTEDLPIVSGIIWKRLDQEWALGIDATLLYVQSDRELTGEDLKDESPYNTRINKGLPPTAIGNPGFASLEAAIYPKESEYWFYLTHPKTGEVIYGVSNADHEANKAKYLQ